MVSGSEPLIPRVIHRIWLGGGAMPDILRYYEESWRKHHPRWEMRVWRDEDLAELSCHAVDGAEPGFKRRVDIVRLEILRQAGGVVIDPDVEAIRPLDPLLPGVQAFVGRIRGRHIGNQVLGAAPGHPFFERAVAQLAARPGGSKTTSSKLAGKAFLTDLLADCPEAVTVFPPETFYYEPSFDPPRRPDDFPNVYAVHHALAGYVAVSPLAALDVRFKKFRRAVKTLLADAPPRMEFVDARLEEAEFRLRRGVEKHDRGFRAELRRVVAEREQALGRLRDAERELAATIDRLARLERRSILARAQQLTERLRRSKPGAP